MRSFAGYTWPAVTGRSLYPTRLRTFPGTRIVNTYDAFSFWIEVPDVDTILLEEAALKGGVLIEHNFSPIF